MSKPRIRVMQIGNQVAVATGRRGQPAVWTNPETFCKDSWQFVIQDHQRDLKMFGDPSKYEEEKKWILDQVNRRGESK